MAIVKPVIVEIEKNIYQINEFGLDCMYVSYDDGTTVSRIVSFCYDEDCLNLNSGVMESHWCYEVHVPD